MPDVSPGSGRSTRAIWPTRISARTGPRSHLPCRFKQMPKELGTPLYEAVFASPFGNELLLEFATDAPTHEHVGQRGVTDLMSVSFSSNDSVGHTYGPESPQVRDITIRTDRVIGQLLDRVDKAVGLQHTLIALTADQRRAPLPENLTARSMPGGRMANKELFGAIQKGLKRNTARGVAGVHRRIVALSQLRAHRRKKLSLEEVRRVAADAALAVPHVTRVYTATSSCAATSATIASAAGSSAVSTCSALRSRNSSSSRSGCGHLSTTHGTRTTTMPTFRW